MATYSVTQGSSTIQISSTAAGFTQNSNPYQYYLNNANAGSNTDSFIITFADGASIRLTDFLGRAISSSGANVLGIPGSTQLGFNSSINIIGGSGWGDTFDIFDNNTGVKLLDDYKPANSFGATNPYAEPYAVIGYSSGQLTIQAPTRSSGGRVSGVKVTSSGNGSFPVSPTRYVGGAGGTKTPDQYISGVTDGSPWVFALTAPDTTPPSGNSNLRYPTFATGSQSPFGLNKTSAGFGSVALVDIDGDGDLDVFSGSTDGKILYYKNTSTTTVPAYAAETNNPFGISSIGGGFGDSKPTLADIDGDLDFDLFTGGSGGPITIQLNTGSRTNPIFGSASINPYGITSTSGYAIPTLVDIDADADLDLFVGNNLGNVLFFRNSGSNLAPSYEAAITNPFGISDVGDRSAPTFADVDLDSDLDLLVGRSDGNILYFENTKNASGDPAYRSASFLRSAKNTGDASPALADLNGDNILDLLVSNGTNFYLNSGSGSASLIPITSSTTNGVYGPGAVITLTLQFSEIVFVTGLPRLQLETGTTDQYATYFSGSGSTTLSFQYTVAVGDISTDLDQLSSSALTLNSGTIRDAAGNNALLELAEPGSTGSLASNAQIIIDTVAPTGTLALAGGSTAPAYAASTSNPFGISDVGNSANPVFTDVDGDSDLDLFIGNKDGNTIYFQNTGSASAPAYAASTSNPFGISDVGYYASPALADVDGDSDLDLFIGNSDGNTIYFQNTGSASAPAYAASTSNPFGISDVGNYASPALADVDGDSDLDLFIGNRDGNTIYFQNTGSASAPAYAASTSNPFGISDVGNYASPVFTDVDGDSDLDLFIGNSDGNTIYFQNTGSASAPAYAASTSNPFNIKDVGNYASPVFTDVDGDSDLDLFIGNKDGNTIYFQNTAATPVAPVISTTANGTYGVGTLITFTIGFSEAVLVTGSPTLQLETGSTDRYATYSSGTGSNTLSFQYTVQAGDTSADLDQRSSSALTLNGGTIKDAAGNNAILTLAAPGATGSLGANAQLVIETTAPSGNSNLRYPTFATGSQSPFGLNKTSAGFGSVALVDIDGDGDLDVFSGSTDGKILYYKNTSTTTVPAYAAETNNPFGILSIGGGFGDSKPTLADIDGDLDFDLITGGSGGPITIQLNTGSGTNPIFGIASINPYGITSTSGYAIPTLVDIDADADLDLFVGNNLGNVLFFRNSGSNLAPSYEAAITNPFGISDVGDRSAPTFADVDLDSDLDLLVGRSDGNILYFENTKNASGDPAYRSASFLRSAKNTGDASPALADLNGDNILDLLVSNGTNFYLNSGSGSASLIPITSSTTNGVYGPGAVITLTLQFSEIVFVTGLPRLQLETGTTDQYATYFSGSGSTTLSFQYTVAVGDISTDLDQLSSSALTLNSGTIRDAAGNNALLELAEPGSTGSLASNAQIIIDTVAPTGTLALAGGSTAPAYAASTSNPFGISDVGNYASPVFTDVDGDSDLDLFIGNRDGNTIYFQNTGSASAPAYAASTSNPFGISDVGNYASPVFTDVDGDSDLDLFIGNRDGNTIYFQNTGSASAPAYAASTSNPFNIKDVGNYASPVFTDVDGDSDLDLFIGNRDGNTIYFQNTGSASAPAYAASTSNPFGISDVGNYASPVFTDVDGDSDLDLFIGNRDGNTIYFQNTGSASAPAYAASTSNPFNIKDVGNYASPVFTDVDGDSDLDLFIGNSDGNTIYFQNTAVVYVAPVTSPKPNGSYGIGSVITITVGFSEAVLVTGSPTLQLETGAIDRVATYSSGTGSNTLSFQYTVQAGDTSADLDQRSSSALTLNGGTIKDAAGNNAILTLAAPGATGSLGANAQLVIDTTAPTGSLGSYATTPAYSAAVTNPYGITNVGLYAHPALADLDRDGDLDLFIGNYFGNTFVFSNTAASGATTPAYSAAVTNPYGITNVGNFASPALADLDRDGDLDLSIGNYDGNTLVFTNTAASGATTPAYSAAVTNPYGITNVGIYARPALADLDGDGDLDLFIGNRDGNTIYFQNTGSASAPAYAASTSNPFNIKDVGNYASPALADLDGDGDLDLFIGNNYFDTLVFTNTAASGATTPAYSAAVTNPYGITDVGSLASPAFADLDGDGDLDLFIGNSDGNTLVFTNTAATPVAPVISTTANGTYGVGTLITLTIGFSETVLVTGSPTLQLETGATDQYATYSGGSGSNTLSFQYTVQEGDTSADLDQLSSSALTLNGGSIKDAAGNNAILTLAAPGTTGSLGANQALVISTNQSPTSLTPSATSFNENIAAGTAIATLSSLDPDATNTFTYSLISGAGSTDNAAFTIAGDQLKINSSPNYEAKSSYSIRLRTTDQGGLSFDREVVLSVLDVNETATALNLSISNFNENIAAGTAIATLSSLDPDAANTFTYSLISGAGSTDNSAFTIAGDQLKITASPDFEAKSSYAIRLRTTDQGGLSFDREVVLSVLDANEAATALNLSISNFNENIAAGTAVATLSSLDPDAANTFTYSLITGAGSTDNSAFTIAGDQLKITASPNFEAKSSYAIRLRTTDQGGLSFDREVVLSVLDVNETATALNLSISNFNENIAAGTAVATLSSLDPDAANTFTYSLISGAGSTDNAAFTIAGDQLKINSSPNYEAKSSYAIRLQTTDQGGLSFDREVVLSVLDVNETATALNLSISNFNENIAAGTAVATLSSLDPDAANTFTYSLISGAGSTDNSAFTIAGNQLKITASPNFEAKSSYAIRLRTMDQGGLSFDREVVLSVLDANEAATALNLSISNFNENIAAGTAVATLSSLDPDAANTFTYSLITGAGSTDNSAFTIAGDQLKITASPNFEAKSSYAIRLRTTDQGGLSFDREVVLSVLDVNETATALNLSISNFNENIAAGTAVATLSSLDPDAANTFTYSLISGAGSTDNAAFTITGDQLKITASPNFEAKSSYAIRLRTTDQGGLSFDREVVLSVLDVNETATALNLSASNFNENIAAGTAVATLSSLDPDAANTFTYSLISGAGSTDNAAFTIAGDQLKITASPDFEAKSSYAIRLRTTDQGGLSFEREVVLAVSNVNETATALNLSISNFNENIAAGTAIATLSSLDPDAANTFTYSLITGAGSTDNAAFTIAGDQLKINSSPNYEAKSSYAIRLRTTDQGGLSFDREVVLSVLDVNETATALNLSISNFNENIAAGTAVVTLSSLDPDAANTFTYSLIAGAGSTDNSAFTIAGDQLKINSSPNYESKSSYAIRLRTTDQGGLSFEREVVLAVSNLNETATALNLSISNFNENIAAGTAVVTLSSLDPDAANTFTYSLIAGAGSTDNSAFTIAGDQLKINSSPNYESKSSYAIRLRTTDQGGLSFEREVVLAVSNLNETATALNLSISNFNENIAAGTAVATLSSLDPDAANTFTYSLISGAGSTDNSAFTIAGDQLKINSSPNYEAKSSYSIRLRTTDQGGLSFDREVVLSVLDVNETATALNLSISNFNENIAAGTAIATLSSLDPDAANTFTYSLISGAGSTDNSAFTIAGDQLKINSSPNYESKSSYAIRLRTTDQGGLSFDREVMLSVSNVNETATALNLSISNFNENIAVGTAIATLSSLDPDAANTFTYSLIAGAGSTDNSAFTIAGDQLKINSSPNYEAKSSYAIRLRTTDQGGLSFEREVVLLLAKQGQSREIRDLSYTTSTGQTTSARLTTTSGKFTGDVSLNRLVTAPSYANQNANLSIGKTGLDFSLNLDPASTSKTAKLAIDLAPLLDGVNTTQKRLAYFVYSTPIGGAAPVAMVFTYDPVKKAGARFYDLDGDRSADTADLQFIDGGYGDKDGVKNGVIVDPSAVAAVNIDPVFQVNTANSLTVSDPTDTTSPASLLVRASLKLSSSTVNEIGYVALNANESPLSLSYDLVKERGTLLFHTLQNSDVPDTTKMSLKRDINLINGQKLMFFEVVDNTLEALLKTGSLNSSFRSLDVTKMTDSSAIAGKGGSSINLNFSTDFSGLGELISSQMADAPIFDFSSLAGKTLSGDVLIAREASYDSSIGFYKLERSDGAVRDNLTNSLIMPGEVGYSDVALRSSNLFNGFGSLATANRENKSAAIDAFKDAGLLAPYARVANTGETYFSFAAANSDGLSHFRVLGSGVLGLEDIKGNGDRDFDDLIASFNFKLK